VSEAPVSAGDEWLDANSAELLCNVLHTANGLFLVAFYSVGCRSEFPPEAVVGQVPARGGEPQPLGSQGLHTGAVNGQQVEQARVGAALHIHLPGGDAGSPDVIVESYFSAANTAGDSARLIGQSASGDNFDYNSAAGTTANLGGGSASSAVVPQALGTTAIFFGSAGWGSLAPLAGIVGGIAVLNALEDKGEAPRSLASYTGADVHAMTPAQVAALSSADPAAFSSADIVALGTDFGFLSTAALDALSAGQLGAIIQAQRGALLARDYADPLASGTRMQLLSTELAQAQDATSADGTANGSTPLANYINRATGTDVVSSAESAAEPRPACPRAPGSTWTTTGKTV
jgi:hypothetical protein